MQHVISVAKQYFATNLKSYSHLLNTKQAEVLVLYLKDKIKINKIRAQDIETFGINNSLREGMFLQITTVFNGE